jgi:hypothetical protein
MQMTTYKYDTIMRLECSVIQDKLNQKLNCQNKEFKSHDSPMK